MEADKCDAIGWSALDNLPKPLSLITQMDLLYYKSQKQKEAKPQSIGLYT